MQRQTLHVHTCSGRNRIIPLMRRPNTDSTPKKTVTLQRKPTFDTLRGSRVPSTLSRYGVTMRGNVTSVYPPLIEAIMTQLGSLQNVRESHPASCTTGTGSLLVVNRAKRSADHTPPSIAEVKDGISSIYIPVCNRTSLR